jgi:hypothetical protein
MDKLSLERRRMASANDPDMQAHNQLRKLKRLAKNQQLMIASNDGFVLVEDLDEYLAKMPSQPLTTKELLADAYDQLETAFAKAEAQKHGINP